MALSPPQLDDQTNATDSIIRRPDKASTIPREEWERHKADIHRYYIEQNHPLTEVVTLMEKKGLKASVAQYWPMFREWGFKKNKRHVQPSDRLDSEAQGKRPRTTRGINDSHLQDSAPTISRSEHQLAPSGNTTNSQFDWSTIDITPVANSFHNGVLASRNSDQFSFLPADSVVGYPDNPGNQLYGPNRFYSINPNGQFRTGLTRPSPMQTFPLPDLFDQEPYNTINLSASPAMTEQVNNTNTSQPSTRLYSGGDMHNDRTICGSSTGNTSVKTKRQPIHHALQKGFMPTVTYLLQKNPGCAHLPDENGCTPLWIASQQGHTKIVKMLMDEYKVDVNTETTESKRTPLHQAAQGGHTEIVRILIENNAEPDSRDQNGISPLWSAAHGGSDRIVEMLLKNGADPQTIAARSSCRPLHEAARNGHLRIVKLLLDYGAEFEPLDDTACSPLFFAAQGGYTEIVELLLQRGADPENLWDGKGRRCLHQAVQNGHLEVVKLLLQHGAAVDPEDDSSDDPSASPLWLAAQNGNTTIGKILIDKGANINRPALPSMRRPLHQAVQNSHEELVKLLIDSKADIEVREEDGWPPVMLAAQNGHLKIIDLFLERGVNLDAQEKDGATALWIASQQGHTAIVKKLLDAGARIFSTKSSKRQPIHQAAQNAHFDVVRLLVESDPSCVNLKDGHGSTPMGLASFGKEGVRLSIMQYLESKGAAIVLDED